MLLEAAQVTATKAAAESSGVFGPSPALAVVDDDVASCELATDWLIADGFDAEWHATSDGALRAVKENDFGVVVTDFTCPR